MSYFDEYDALRDATADPARLAALDELESLRDADYTADEAYDELDDDERDALGDLYPTAGESRWTETDGEGDTTEGEW